MTESDAGTERSVSSLTDPVGVFGLMDATFPDEEHITTVDLEYLKSSITVLEELGWEKVDINVVPPEDGEADDPMLVLRTPRDPFFGTENAALSIAPLSEKGREQIMEVDDAE